jgi:hypothetical protein
MFVFLATLMMIIVALTREFRDDTRFGSAAVETQH